MRVLLGVLVAANLIGAGLVMWPIGGSAEDLERQRVNLNKQVRDQRALLERSRQHVAAVELGRNEGERFLGQYFLQPRTAYSILLNELLTAASQSKIKPRENSYTLEPIEGTDDLSMMVISATFEGSYNDLLHFVNAIDRSPRLLIIESMNAAPQQNGGTLSVAMRMNTFVRASDGGLE
jgi:type IV pilus assembly protein PilO